MKENFIEKKRLQIKEKKSYFFFHLLNVNI